MRKPVVPSTVMANSPCANMAEKAGTACKAWMDLCVSLQACFVKTDDPQHYVLDPFALLRVIAAVRSNASIAIQIGDSTLSEAETWGRQEAQAETLAFDEKLRNFCAREQISVEGRFPLYILGGHLPLRLSLEDSSCTVGAKKKVKSLLVSRVWPEITEAIKKDKLRAFNPSDFLAVCYKTYRKIVTGRNEKAAVSVPIKDFFRALMIELKPEKSSLPSQPRHFRSYTEEYFCRDLARLVKAGQFLTHEGAKIELMPTAFPKDGIPINVDGGIRIIGHIAFSDPPSQ